MPFALITGGSRGIGKAIALALAERNYDILLVARDRRGLLEVSREIAARYRVHVHFFQQDLAEPDAVERIGEWVRGNPFDLEILVNNAGFGLNGAFDSLPVDRQTGIIHVNITALLLLTAHFIPVFKSRGAGYILNVASTAAYQPVPFLNVYSASKAFVLSFSRGLREELRGSGVSVTTLSPGNTESDFLINAGIGGKLKSNAERFSMTAAEVAEAGVKALLKKRSEVVPGITNRLGTWVVRWIPSAWVARVVGWVYKPEANS